MKRDWNKYIRIPYIITVLLIVSSATFAQSTLLKNAEKIYRDNNFIEALGLYEKAIKIYPRDSKINHRLGVCYYETRTNFKKAKKHLKISAAKGIRQSNLYLGKVCFLMYDFDQSEKYFTKYKNYLRHNDDRIPALNTSIEKCQKGLNWLNRIEDITIIDETDVSAFEFFKALPLSAEAGRFEYPENILPIKTDTLIPGFLTERKDRFVFPAVKDGQTDLFDTDKLLDSWSNPNRLSNNINTDSSEIYPFLSTDGITMYFASKGHDGLGDFDLYITRFNADTKSFLPPQNLGFPFNSPFDDYMYVVDEFAETGWFVSNRKAKKDTVTIYKFKPNRYKQLVDSDNKKTLKQRASLLFKWTSEEDTTIVADTDSITIAADVTPILSSVETANQTIRFVINDTIVYTELDQFTSSEAKQQWHKYNNAVTENENTQKKIKELRIEFSNETNAAARNKIAAEVVALENAMFNRAETIANKKIEIRKLEIESILKLQKTNRYKKTELPKPTGSEKEELHPNKVEVPSWQQKPLQIETPDTILPVFQSAALQENFNEIFNQAEIDDLSLAEAKNIEANNRIMHMEELLMQVNMPGDLKKDNRSLWDKVMHLDTTFTPALSRKEIMQKARATQLEGLRQFIDVNNHRFEVLKFKANALAHDSQNKEAQQRVSSIINGAEFYKNDANKYVKDDYVDLGYGAQQLGLAANILKKACQKAEMGVLVGYKAFSTKDVVSAQTKSAVTPEIQKEAVLISEEKPVSEEKTDTISYRVQVGIFSTPLPEEKLSLLNDILTITVSEKQLLKYYSGNYSSKSEAENAVKDLVEKGFTGAFIVPFKNETPISWNEVNLQKK